MKAERMVLGAMLRSHYAAYEALSKLTSKDFHEPANKVIFTAIDHLKRHNKPIDLCNLDEQLTRWGRLEEVGGAAYLVELTRNAPPDDADVGAYIDYMLEISPHMGDAKKPEDTAKSYLRIEFIDGGYCDVDPAKVVILNTETIKAIHPISGDELEVKK